MEGGRSGFATVSFEYHNGAIASSVLFFRRHADADAYWRKTARPAYAPCAARDFATSRPKGTRARTLMAKQIPLGPTAADGGIALRVVTHLSGDSFTPFV